MTVNDVAVYAVLALVCGMVVGLLWGGILRYVRALLSSS